MSDPTTPPSPTETTASTPPVSKKAAFWNSLGSVFARLGVYLAEHPEVVQAAVNIAVAAKGAK